MVSISGRTRYMLFLSVVVYVYKGDKAVLEGIPKLDPSTTSLFSTESKIEGDRYVSRVYLACEIPPVAKSSTRKKTSPREEISEEEIFFFLTKASHTVRARCYLTRARFFFFFCVLIFFRTVASRSGNFIAGHFSSPNRRWGSRGCSGNGCMHAALSQHIWREI